MSKQPAKLRLLASMKGLLAQEAEKHIYPTLLKAEYDAAYAAAKPRVTAAVTAKFKKSDMDVLVRFDCSRRAVCAKLHYPNGVIQQFDWSHDDCKCEIADDTRPLIPDTPHYRY